MRVFLQALTLALCLSSAAEAHRSGCHRWHSCPSDSGSYICGDIGRCSGCPNNQYCEDGRPISNEIENNKNKQIPQFLLDGRPISSETENNKSTQIPHSSLDQSFNNSVPKKLDTIKFHENDYVNFVCPRMNGEIEFTLDDGSRVDCETDTHSIEFDFSKKWAEAIGQALYYSSKTGKKPGIVLIINKESGLNNLKKIRTVAKKYGFNIKLWSIKPGDLTENN